MNFSQPGSAALTTTSSSSNNNKLTPLTLAHSLYTDLSPPASASISISTFTTSLTAIHSATHLFLLPKTTPQETSFHRAETSRIANGPLGRQVLQMSAFLFSLAMREPVGGDDGLGTRNLIEDIHDATDLMLAEVAKEADRHLDDMALLLAAMKAKWKVDLEETGSFHHIALNLGPSGVASAQALADLVGDRPKPPPHRRCINKTYLSDIARHWRTWGGGGPYEEIWTYVAGRPLRQE